MTPLQRRCALSLLWMLATAFGLIALLLLFVALQMTFSNGVILIAISLALVCLLYKMVFKIIPGAQTLFSS